MERTDLDAGLVDHLERWGEPLGQCSIFAQPPKDVFHVNHRIIDQRADGMAIPPRVMVLMVAPNACKVRTVVRSDSGMAVRVMTAALRLARKRSTWR